MSKKLMLTTSIYVLWKQKDNLKSQLKIRKKLKKDAKMTLEKYVITGGPGVGKTTLIEELKAQGYATVPEASRMVILEEQQKNTGILPWTNLYEFQKLVVQKQQELEVKVIQEARCIPNSAAENFIFLDRGMIDNIAYCREGRIAVPEELEKAVAGVSYAGIFLLDPLSSYAQDAQRKEDGEKAEKLHQFIQEVYQEQGYAIIQVPVLSVEERVSFLLGKIKEIRKLK